MRGRRATATSTSRRRSSAARRRSTFIVTDEPDGQNQAITREEGERWAQAQDEYIAEQEMVVVDGYIGNDPEFRTAARLYIEAANANIAGMQQQLYFSPADGEELEPELTVIYTPNLKAEGYPDDRLIAVDLEQGVTRVFNSDYFGESKKGGLRMWNKLVYDRGGIPLHAGCKIIPTEQGKRVGLIVGLSGTGKTTTTFTRQNGSLPVQDDFVAWMPNGRVYATENGCFAKTFGLNPEDEPTIYARRHAAALVPRERLAARRRGRLLRHRLHLERARDLPVRRDRGRLRRRDRRGALPPDPEQEREHRPRRREARRAAGSGLLHARRDDRARAPAARTRPASSCACPGRTRSSRCCTTCRATASSSCSRSNPLEVYVMNTGRVGGPDGDERSRKVRIKHSSAIVKGIAEGTIEWERDPDFGYLVAASVPGIDEPEILQPRRLYEEQGRGDEYRALVERFKAERAEFLRGFSSLSDEIVAAVS